MGWWRSFHQASVLIVPAGHLLKLPFVSKGAFCAVCQSRPFMGRNRKLVSGLSVRGCLEDNPEGSTTSISAMTAVSTQRVSRRRSGPQSEEGERQGSRPSKRCWQRFREAPTQRDRHQGIPMSLSESRRTSCSSSGSSDEARSRHPSCRRARSCSNGIEGGFAESQCPSTVAASPRPDKSHRSISEPVSEEVGDHAFPNRSRTSLETMTNPQEEIGQFRARKCPMVQGMGFRRSDRKHSAVFFSS